MDRQQKLLFKQTSPTLKRLLASRPAPIREAKLFEAALSAEKPVKPPPGECCGSSCDPCVMDLYAQEVRVWKECREVREGLGEDQGQGEGDGGKEEKGGEGKDGLEGKLKVPGAFEW